MYCGIIQPKERIKYDIKYMNRYDLVKCQIIFS